MLPSELACLSIGLSVYRSKKGRNSESQSHNPWNRSRQDSPRVVSGECAAVSKTATAKHRFNGGWSSPAPIHTVPSHWWQSRRGAGSRTHAAQKVQGKNDPTSGSTDFSSAPSPCNPRPGCDGILATGTIGSRRHQVVGPGVEGVRVRSRNALQRATRIRNHSGAIYGPPGARRFPPQPECCCFLASRP